MSKVKAHLNRRKVNTIVESFAVRYREYFFINFYTFREINGINFNIGGGFYDSQ